MLRSLVKPKLSFTFESLGKKFIVPFENSVNIFVYFSFALGFKTRVFHRLWDLLTHILAAEYGKSIVLITGRNGFE